tara:strand:- start:1082 stop:1333 length:252 start_codon:yes stop_codon:yes gene_type:complete
MNLKNLNTSYINEIIKELELDYSEAIEQYEHYKGLSDYGTDHLADWEKETYSKNADKLTQQWCLRAEIYKDSLDNIKQIIKNN